MVNLDPIHKKKMHLNGLPDMKPVCNRAYPVPHFQKKTFSCELDHLVSIGVLKPTGSPEWAVPTFIIPKKDGQVHWVSDFCELNKAIKCKVINCHGSQAS